MVQVKGPSPIKVMEFSGLLYRDKMISPAYVSLDAQGCIIEINQNAPRPIDAAYLHEKVPGWVIPGFCNGHSHAFQYAMTGLAEHVPAKGVNDDFWSWRETMYQLALNMTPEAIEAIAALLYAEMLRYGYTTVVEFQYLHHDQNGQNYNQIAELSLRHMAAAQQVGIRLVMIPVLYQKGGFGKEPLSQQRRFVCKNIQDYLDIYHQCCASANEQFSAHGFYDAYVGFGVHSLRAVDPEIIKSLFLLNLSGPRHMHIAEQRREVADSLAYLGKTPMRWLLDEIALDQRYFLTHATHIDEQEAKDLAKSQAQVVLCPSTEGNLGDGFFPLATFLDHGGNILLGSDSQIGLNPCEDLRWLDYGQRLTKEKRNIICTKPGTASAQILLSSLNSAASQALGTNIPHLFANGQPFDAVVVKQDHPIFLGKPEAHHLGALIYASDSSCLLGTIRRGNWLVRDGRHRNIQKLSLGYKQAMQKIWSTKTTSTKDMS